MDLLLDDVSDDRVLARVRWLVGRSNEITAELLAYLAEVEERGLHLREATSSLFAFCVERLYLTEENCAALLGRAAHRTRREIEAIVAEIAPRPDVRSRVAEVPAPRREPEPLLARGSAAATTLCAAPASSGQEGRSRPAVAAPVPPRPAVVAALAPQRYEVRVTVGEETHAALRQLQDLLAHQVPTRDPALIIARALELLLARTLARKAAVTERPRAGIEPTRQSRHIPAAVRRAVWERDAARCAFVDSKGRRCAATHMLEFHHVENWARGAEHEASEIELRCRPHNQYQAVLDDGPALIAKHRGQSRAEEPPGQYAPARTGSGERGRAHALPRSRTAALGAESGSAPSCNIRAACSRAGGGGRKPVPKRASPPTPGRVHAAVAVRAGVWTRGSSIGQPLVSRIEVDIA